MAQPNTEKKVTELKTVTFKRDDTLNENQKQDELKSDIGFTESHENALIRIKNCVDPTADS